jgi:Lsr2
MAKAMVQVLVDDLDGSEGAETVRIGWNGEWRELELSKKNLSALSRALDTYWNVSRPVSRDGRARGQRRSGRAKASRSSKSTRDPKVIRAWATDNGISVPARGRIPGAVERQYNDAVGRS